MDAMPPVIVRVSVDPNGFVTDAQVASATSGGDADALSAARQWVFTPGQEAWTTYIGFSFAGPQPGTIPVSVGGNIRPPGKTMDVKPVYPEVAQQAHIQGVQIVESIINEEGRVVDAWVLRGQDVLIPAALNAVLGWRFEPGLQNGVPFPLKMTVTVNFTLGDSAAPSSGGAGGTTGAVELTPPLEVRLPLPSSWPANTVVVSANGIRPPAKIRDVKPVYPTLALQARVQGATVFDVLIGTDGRVVDAVLRRSIPLLDQAAVEAVRQWEFTPTLLNGNPVPVAMAVTVNFTLQ
jgi:TonB family protein